MLANIFLKTLRDHRWSVLGWGLGLGAIVAFVIQEYGVFMGNPEQQAAFAKSYQAFGFLVGEYVPIDTLGGFLSLETMVYGSLLVGLWAAVAGVASTRGEEEPGTLDVLMSTPHSRQGLFWQKAAALFAGIVLVCMLVGVLMYPGLWIAGRTLPFWAIVGTVVNVAVSALFWGAAGLLAGQLTERRRTASIATGTLIFATYLFNTIAETISSLKGFAWISPFHYYNASKPLVPGRGLDWPSVAVMLLGAAVLLGLAALLFERRDTGAAVALRRTRRSERAHTAPRRASSVLLGSTFGAALRELAMPTLGWGVGLGLYCAMMVGTTTEVLTPLYEGMKSIPFFTKLFGEMVSNEAYLSVGVFFYLPLLLALFALVQIWGWATDEEEGRTEELVSTPTPRWQVAVARYASSTISLAVILSLTTAGVLLTAQVAGVSLDPWRMAGAVFASGPVVLLVLALGLAIATWLPRPGAAVGITGAVVVVMFFISTLAPLFDWPEAVRRLSIFYYYGRPALDGVPWGDLGILMAGTVALGVASLVGFQRRDLVS